jgi:ectoine hydroxylase-related dioxygenase (phytanoyl-CoA dioxygenase family)
MIFRPEDHHVVPLRDSTELLLESERLREQANQDGYLYLPGLVPRAPVDRVRALARGLCERFGWVVAEPDNPPSVHAVPGARLSGRGFDDPRFVELQQTINQTDEFCALGRQTEVLRILGIVYGEPARGCITNILWVKLPGSPEHTTLPHQDIHYVPQWTDLWTAWYPLVDTPFDLGPLGVVPGSNRLGCWEHESRERGIVTPPGLVWASSEVHPGDVLLFSSHTVHAAWSNISAQGVRFSADVRFLKASSELS